MWFEPKYVLKQRAQEILAIIPKVKPKVQFPTRLSPKKENDSMLVKNVVLWHYAKICLYRGRNVRNWFYNTKPNYICAADGMLKVGFGDQTESCLYHGPNIRWWFGGQG